LLVSAKYRISVSDPYSFDPDHNPAFEAENRSRSRALMTKSWGKIYSGKKVMFFDKKLHYYLSLGLHKGCPSYRRSLKREHPALQNIKFLNFFLFLWVIFALLDPDPDFESGSVYGFEDLIESGSGSRHFFLWIRIVHYLENFDLLFLSNRQKFARTDLYCI
jgi:hypothetical protein